MSGFLGGLAGALRRGTSRSRVHYDSDQQPPIRQPSLTCSPLLKPARELFWTLPHNALMQASPFAPSLLRRSGEVGRKPYVLSYHGSLAKANRNSSVSHSDTSFKIAQRISCALHRENARAILKRAPEQAVSPCSSLSLSLLSESAP